MINLDTSLRAARMLEAGRLTATFTSLKTGQHITIAAKCRTINEDDKWVASSLADSKVVFFEVPNESGFGDKVGKLTRGKGFVPAPGSDGARVYCARMLLHWLQGNDLPEGLTVVEEERCGKCGRALTDPVSIERGIGPECYGAATGSTHQVKERPAKAAPTPRKPAVDKNGVPYGFGDWKARKQQVKRQQPRAAAIVEAMGPAPEGAYEIPY